MKKGKEIVEMNERAIDAGATAFVKINVPAEWANAEDVETPATENGPAKLVKMVDSKIFLLCIRIFLWPWSFLQDAPFLPIIYNARFVKKM